MRIPPEIEAKIAQKQDHAWEIGLIQGFTWYINNVMKPTRKESRKKTHFSLAGKEFAAIFDGYISSDGEYEGSAHLFRGMEELLFELSFQGQTEEFSPRWATRGPSAQSAVKAFIEGPWVGQFLSYLSELKEKQKAESEISQKMIEENGLEDLKKRFGLS
jgi:hypothetical protein